jgi:hypothetical protein
MRQFVLAALAGAALLPGAAWAEPGLASEVYGPEVERGESEFELRSGSLDGGAEDGDGKLKAEFSHGVTDWWRPGLIAGWASQGGDTDFTGFAIENVFDFTATRDWPVHFGGYVEYEWARGGADEVELKLLMQRESGPLELTANLIAERYLGAGADWEYGYAAESGFALNDDVALGVQGFGEFGSDGLAAYGHYWGPFGEIELGHFGEGEVGLQLGYLFGAGDAVADGQFRLKLEYEFGES